MFTATPRELKALVGLGTTNYLYDGINVLEEADSEANVQARYSQSPYVDEPLAQWRSGTASYYQQDVVGSVSSLSNSASVLANTYTYDSFGNISTSSGTLVNPFRYTGREYDNETNLYFNRARYYDPGVAGRFLSQDPVGFLGGSNYYVYVRNSPLNWLDPLGLAPQQANHSNPPPGCNFPECFWYYGNWGGPGWTGGQWKPYEDLTPDEQDHLAPPIDAQDACYQEHDRCYSRSRVKNKCTAHDKPNRSQEYNFDQGKAGCDFELARCLKNLGNSPAWNPAAAVAEFVFVERWFLLSNEQDPSTAPVHHCAGINCLDNK